MNCSRTFLYSSKTQFFRSRRGSAGVVSERQITPAFDQEAVWESVRANIERLLAECKLGHGTLERAADPPKQSPGGKFRAINPLKQERGES